MDVIIDFSQFNTGDLVYLVNRLVMRPDGRGPAGGNGIAGAGGNATLPAGQGDRVLQFRVGTSPSGGDPSQVPTTLRANPALPGTTAQILANSAIPKRNFLFERRNGLWVVNGRVFDNDPHGVTPKQTFGFGTNVLGEVWTIRNIDNGWSHPVHIHFEEFRILTRNGVPPPAYEQVRKDVVSIGQEEVKVFLRFRDFLGRFPMHCHNVVHEDHAMMTRWDIVP
jgi:FtsP/CotA-like multicopper oxidase with cupredoxin domain